VAIILFSVAWGCVLAAGLGLWSWLWPRETACGWAERLSVAWLAGSAYVAVASFLGGFWLAGWPLRWLVTGGALALLASACVHNHCSLFGQRVRRLGTKSDTTSSAGRVARLFKAALLALGVFQIALVFLVAQQTGLGWDGLFIWEFKARITFLNGGVLPHEFFSDPSRQWTHPTYPPLVPLNEAWLYGWLGEAHQGALKWWLPWFYAALLGLLHGVVRRHTQRDWPAGAAFLVLLLIPQMTLGAGSASSGYADFTLAVFYFAAVAYALSYWRDGQIAWLWLACVLAAALVWVKQEGVILWVCVMGLAGWRAWQLRDLRRWVVACVPGLVLLLGWRMFLRSVDAWPSTVFLPVTLEYWWQNCGRLGSIAWAAARELVVLRHWGGLWVLTMAATVLSVYGGLAARRKPDDAAKQEADGIPSLGQSDRPFYFVLPLALWAPCLVEINAYVFSAWPEYLTHVRDSFPRLLVHLTPLAVLLITVSTVQYSKYFCRIARKLSRSFS
jgi:hypothetical protein